MTKNISLYLISCILFLFSFFTVNAQYAPTTIVPQIINNTTVYTNAQCNDGPGGQPAVANVRFYHNTDIYRPHESHTSTATNIYFWRYLLGSNQSRISMNNMGYNSFQLLGTFNIKSWGKPLNVPTAVVWRLDDGMKAINHHPTDTTQQVGQLVYELHRKAYSLTQWGGFTNHGAIGPFGYQTTPTGVMQNISQYNPSFSDNHPSRNVSGKLECYNMYVSRCGDGYLDTPGSSTKPGYANHSVPLASNSLANEQCDPGNPSQGIPAVIPAGQPAGTTCSPTCTLVASIPAIVTYTKTVRNVTTNSDGGQFVEADNLATAVVVNTGDAVQYQITVNKTGGPAVNTLVNDVLPTNNGFIMTGYRINNGPIIAASSFPQTDITTQLNIGPATITLYGAVGNPTATSFVNTANITNNGIPANTLLPGSNVAWTKLPDMPPATPSIWITKEVETANGSNTRHELTNVSPGQTLRFKITYGNTGNASAINALISDTLPAGLTCVSAIHQNGTPIPCNGNTISYTQPVLNPGATQYIILTFTVNNDITTGIITNIASIQLPDEPPLTDPAQVQPVINPDFSIVKRVVTGTVAPGAIVTYEIKFKNTGNTIINSYTITDPLQNSIYVAASARLNGTILINPTINGSTLTRGCNTAGNVLNGTPACPLAVGAEHTITFNVSIVQ